MNRLSLPRLLGALILGIATQAISTAVAGDLYQYDTVGRVERVTYATGRIVVYQYDGNSNITSIVSSVTTGVEPTPGTPAFVNALRASEPNPAFGEARLRFSIARAGRTTLRIFDVSGRLVRTVTDRDYPPGEYEATTSLSTLAAGVYFYRLEALGFRAVRRIVVLK